VSVTCANADFWTAAFAIDLNPWINPLRATL
jgi:hypothetical protein